MNLSQQDVSNAISLRQSSPHTAIQNGWAFFQNICIQTGEKEILA